MRMPLGLRANAQGIMVNTPQKLRKKGAASWVWAKKKKKEGGEEEGEEEGEEGEERREEKEE